MSNTDPDNPEGISLGRLIAAEKNAQAALNTIKDLHKVIANYDERIANVESQIAGMRQENNQLRAQVAGMTGGTVGPTA